MVWTRFIVHFSGFLKNLGRNMDVSQFIAVDVFSHSILLAFVKLAYPGRIRCRLLKIRILDKVRVRVEQPGTVYTLFFWKKLCPGKGMKLGKGNGFPSPDDAA